MIKTNFQENFVNLTVIRKGKELILERVTEERELNEGLLNKMEEKEGRSNEKDWLLEDT